MSFAKQANPCNLCDRAEKDITKETFEEASPEKEEKTIENNELEMDDQAEEDEKEYKELLDPRDNLFHVATCITFALPCVVFLLNFVQLDDDYLWNITS
tara:strand:+ start:870 stop:1166 length:297 start_codon:yes stop_codon:yes gene_type:complete